MGRLCGLPLHDEQLKIYTKIKADTQKCNIQPTQINLRAVFSKENSVDGCYAGYIHEVASSKTNKERPFFKQL